ncbi:MAG TPA: hypothetical protein VJU61_16625 [Polyangiaceae bacterium]|nr:hypothetical protein [Polyangiaceae bacterium]
MLRSMRTRAGRHLTRGLLPRGELALWQRLRRIPVDSWLIALSSLTAAFYALRSANFFLRMNAALHFDDGYVTSIGERLLDGHLLPYVDAASHRGPVMYWLAALAQALGGRMEWYGVRALTSLAFLTSAGGIWLAATLARRRFAGAAAALSFVFISMVLLELQTVFGLVGEAIATPWLVSSFVLCSWALGREQPFAKRCALLGGAGMLAALSGLTKQTYLPVVGPLGLWAVAAALSEPATSRFRRWAGLGALVAGWLLPLVLVLLLYAVKGELGTFYYWFYRYNVDVYMAPFEGARLVKTLYRWARDNGYLSFSLVVVVASVTAQHLGPVLGSLRQLPQAYARRGFELTVLLQALLALAIGFSTLRFWPQYFLPPVPWVALLIGLSLEQPVGQSPHVPETGRRPWAGLLVGTLLFGGFVVAMVEQGLYALQQDRNKGAWGAARPERACENIDRLAPAGAPIFIWGFDGDLYVTCRRHSASRFVYASLVAGQVPPDWRAHPEWSARDSVNILLSEFDELRPPLILDSPARLHGVSITQVPRLDAYLHEHYCKAGDFRSNDGRRMEAWQRLDLCPAAAEPPRPVTLPAGGPENPTP